MRAIVRSISFGAIPALLILATLTACQKPFPYYGVWRGYRNVPTRPGADEDVARQIAKIQVTVKETERFEIAINGLAATGVASHEGGKLVLTPQEVMGMPMERQPDSVKSVIPTSTLTPNKDGSVTFNAPGVDPLILERIATAPLDRP